MLKKILIGLFALAAVLFALSLWQSNKRAAILVDNLAETAAAVGTWNWSRISSNTEGQIKIHDMRFQPSGFQQGVIIDEVILTLDPMFLLKADPVELRNFLPGQMNIALSGVRLQHNGHTDFQQALLDHAYWPVVVGYLGAPGCGDKGPWAFSMAQWQAMLEGEPVEYALNFYYEHTGNGEIDFQADTEAQNLWMTSWSGQLKSAVGASEFAFEDLLLKDVFYYHQDNGFNQRRNRVCAEKYQGSFAAYRKNSAQTVQNLVRGLVGKELSDKLLNWYQRTLLPEAEFFVEFHLSRSIYLDELFHMPQNLFLGQAEMAVGLGENAPEPVMLNPIRYDKVDADTLVKAYREEVRQQRAARLAAEKQTDKTHQRKAARRVIGGKVARYQAVDDIRQAVGRKVRIITRKGRVINGVVRRVTDQAVVVSINYLTGSAEFNLAPDEIQRVELLKVR